MSSQIKISVDGKSIQVASDQRPTHLFEGKNDVVVCRINGQLSDLWSELSDGDVIESVLIDSEDGLNVLRHSTAHVLAQAVQEVFADTKLGIGPPIRDGFYYDFDPKNPFTPSVICSGTASTSVTNGMAPKAMASITTIGNPSQADVIKRISLDL